MLRTLVVGLLAVGLHAGIGFGAHEAAERYPVQHPIRAKKVPLVSKQLMKEIRERIKELEEPEDIDDVVEVALEPELEEELRELEENIDKLESDNSVASLELGYAVAQAEPPPAPDPEGSAGDPEIEPTPEPKRYAVKGPDGNADPHIADAAALRDAAEFGMIGMLNSGASIDVFSSGEAVLGSDAVSALGGLAGDSIGDSFGAGGLGLAGIGEGGGGTGEGIGLGSVGTIGRVGVRGTAGGGQGYGTGHGRLGGRRLGRVDRGKRGADKSSKDIYEGGEDSAKPSKPKKKSKARARVKSVSTTGDLDKSAIKRALKRKQSRFRRCYQAALKDDPTLAGNVRLRIRVTASGSVVIGKRSETVTTTVSDSVAECALNVVSGMTFATSNGGFVSFRIALTR